MRLAEFGSRKIEVAGKAKLRYSVEEKTPRREGVNIVLPNYPLNEMVSLKEDWSQFLFKSSNYQGLGGVYFGGTDENPFLVQMDDGIFDILLTRGPEYFYSYILPSRLMDLIPKVADYQSKLRRQGDIFCLSMSYSPWSIVDAGKLIFGDTERYTLRTTEDYSIFGTRHELTGEAFQNIGLLGETLPLVVRGVINAPDHSPLELPRLSVLAQTQHLYSPKEAD